MKVTAITKTELKDRRSGTKKPEQYNYTKKEIINGKFLKLLFEALTGGKYELSKMQRSV